MAHFGLNSRIDEKWCKGDEVQEELNILTAGLDTLRSVPGKAPYLGVEQDDVWSIRLIASARDVYGRSIWFISRQDWPKTSICNGHPWTTPISPI
jgi:hypothetical protein